MQGRKAKVVLHVDLRLVAEQGIYRRAHVQRLDGYGRVQRRPIVHVPGVHVGPGPHQQVNALHALGLGRHVHGHLQFAVLGVHVGPALNQQPGTLDVRGLAGQMQSRALAVVPLVNRRSVRAQHRLHAVRETLVSANVYGRRARDVQHVDVHVVLGQQQSDAAHGPGLYGAEEHGGLEPTAVLDERVDRVHGVRERGEVQGRHVVGTAISVAPIVQQPPQTTDATIQGAYVHGTVASQGHHMVDVRAGLNQHSDHVALVHATRPQHY